MCLTNARALAGGWLVFGLTVFIVSCGNSGGTTTFVRGDNNLGQSSGVVCPAVEIKAAPMIFPANGATGVSPNIGLIYFSGSASIYSQAEVELTASPGGAITLGGPLVAASSPVPAIVASTAGTSDVSEATVPTLAAGTTYIVSLTSSPCPLYGGTSGSFTTQ